MHKLLGTLKKSKPKSVLVWLMVIAAGLAMFYILPPVIKGLRTVAKSGGDVAEKVGGAVSNVAGGALEGIQRLLAEFGLATSPYAAKLNYFLKPPADSCWNRYYWETRLTASQTENLYQQGEIYFPQMADEIAHWWGMDYQEVMDKLNEYVGSRVVISYMNDWWYRNKGQSFVRWLNSGWSYLGDKDTVAVCEWAESLPEYTQ